MIPLEAVISLGVGGTLGIVIFLMYRHDRRSSKEQVDVMIEQLRTDRMFMEDRLTGVIKDYNEAAYAQSEANKNLTVVQAELITWLKAKNGH